MTITQRPLTKDLIHGTSKLPPIPHLEFREKEHIYLWKGERIETSCTSILSFDLDEIARQRIEETKPDWQPRGTHIHSVLENHLNGAAELSHDQWGEWCGPLLECPLFSKYRALATEYRLVDKRRRWAGSFDFLLAGQDPKGNDRVIIGDLKTRSKASSSALNAKAQLGCYIATLMQWFPYLVVDVAVTVNSFPGRVDVVTAEPEECLAAWDDRYQAFADWKPSF